MAAILLCRENPAAVRVRPSRGDGGIDILVPLDSADRVAVYQVKSFTSNLTRGQKAQAERSFRRLMDYAAVRGLRVAEWYLTLPVNPTNENLRWLEGFTAGHGLLSQWRGLDFLEGLAAEYPSVIDYYLRDGKNRLQAALESLTTVLRTAMLTGAAQAGADGTGDALEPAEAVGTLAGLHAVLNEHDPHFAYDYSVDTVRPELADQPGLVAAVQESHGKRWVTIKVLARCAESLAERPVPLSIWITAEPGSDLQRDIEAFDKYGTPFTAPMGTTNAEITLPGGLGGTITGGSVRIEVPAGASGAGHDIRLQVTDPSGEVIAETLVHMQLPTTGPSGNGVRGYGAEQHGVFSFEVLTDLDAQTVSYGVHLGDLIGKPPELVLPGVRLLREFRHPNGLRVARPYGPVVHKPDPLPEGADSVKGVGVIADLIEALAVIQDRTMTQVAVPDFAKLTLQQARAILHAADLIRGAVVTVPWEGISIHVHPVRQRQGTSFRHWCTGSSRLPSGKPRRASDTSRSTSPPRESTPQASPATTITTTSGSSPSARPRQSSGTARPNRPAGARERRRLPCRGRCRPRRPRGGNSAPSRHWAPHGPPWGAVAVGIRGRRQPIRSRAWRDPTNPCGSGSVPASLRLVPPCWGLRVALMPRPRCPTRSGRALR